MQISHVFRLHSCQHCDPCPCPVNEPPPCTPSGTNVATAVQCAYVSLSEDGLTFHKAGDECKTTTQFLFCMHHQAMKTFMAPPLFVMTMALPPKLSHFLLYSL
ncbi:unnamed protein product [Chondrus crispus]|uniref:Uncharacterized protein n=1 Tax=Chondrus crispus TaxID=2769 RepID=R7QU56_CHOCR|nr:unnamed protein product [Chondrus crispus]CDF41238.1 unnamed protein product [Chondrus crispus]|eukprot:XP_005711532.1 unnamed protein product [Chondrus crispus]